MTNAEFFARNAIARGQKPSVLDVNPATGRIRTPFDGLRDAQIQRNERVARSTNGGMTIARPGFPSQPKILGVDAKQAADQEYARDHKDDAWWLQAMQARQNDPRAGHMTPEQYAAAVQAHDPTGKLAPAMGIKPPAPVRPPGAVEVAGGGQDRGIGRVPVIRYDPAAPPTPPKPQAAQPPAQPGVKMYSPPGTDPVYRAPYRGEKPPVGADGVPEAIRRPDNSEDRIVGQVAPELPKPMAADPSANLVLGTPMQSARRKKPDGSYDDGQSDEEAGETSPDDEGEESDE